MSPSPSFTHQKVLADLFNKMYIHVEKNKSGIVLAAPFDVFLDRKNAFQPDILFIGNEHLGSIKEDGLHGPPDMVIEILSPSTGKYDLEDKMEVYAKNGVKEYWTVEPHEKRATGYWLVNDEYHEIANDIGVLNSRLLKKKFKFIRTVWIPKQPN